MSFFLNKQYEKKNIETKKNLLRWSDFMETFLLICTTYVCLVKSACLYMNILMCESSHARTRKIHQNILKSFIEYYILSIHIEDAHQQATAARSQQHKYAHRRDEQSDLSAHTHTHVG